MIRSFAGVAALLVVPAASLAQNAPRYLPPHDTVWVERVNPFQMYWVRGTDTLGQGPVHSVSIESQVWRGAGERLEVVSRALSLDTRRDLHVDTTTLRPDGTVAEIGHRPPSVSTRLDFTLRLPRTPLAAGVAWGDTVRAESASIHGPRAYEVVRTLRVVRMIDSLGTTVAEVRGEGTVWYRDAFWADSAQGIYAWLDVTGPVREAFWYDVRASRQVGRTWDMDLRGSGGFPNAGGGIDSLPAGLLSREVQRVVSADRAHLLARPLPGTDTTYTVTRGRALLHTVERSPAGVRSALARNDGMLGTAETVFADGRPATYKATWTDTAAVPRQHRIRADAAGLHLSRAAAGDTVLPIPAGAWAIAEYGMEEHLVPVLLRLPLDGATHPIHVYRPTPGRWDHGTARLIPLPRAFAIALQMEGDPADHLLVVTAEGDLLFAGTRDSETERLPPEGTARRARLEAILAELLQRGRSSAVPRDPAGHSGVE